jgi:hypothetical protein
MEPKLQTVHDEVHIGRGALDTRLKEDGNDFWTMSK